MKIKLKNNHCPNCGAPVLTEVCSYCNALTGIDTRYADMEYGVIECKEAYMSFFNYVKYFWTYRISGFYNWYKAGYKILSR